ncbi:hypothetical protein Tco_0791152 [Tanacetum coccineum]
MVATAACRSDVAARRSLATTPPWPFFAKRDFAVEDYRRKCEVAEVAYEAKRKKELGLLECRELEFLMIDHSSLPPEKAAYIQRKQAEIMKKISKRLICLPCQQYEALEDDEAESSKKHTRRFIPRERELAEEKLRRDCFGTKTRHLYIRKNIFDEGTDISEITRKPLKSSKHGHENQKNTKRSQRFKAEARKVKPQSNPVK